MGSCQSAASAKSTRSLQVVYKSVLSKVAQADQSSFQTKVLAAE